MAKHKITCAAIVGFEPCTCQTQKEKPKKVYRVKLVIDVEAKDEDEAIEVFAERVAEGSYDFDKYDVAQVVR